MQGLQPPKSRLKSNKYEKFELNLGGKAASPLAKT